jgi:hypothetical protein
VDDTVQIPIVFLCCLRFFRAAQPFYIELDASAMDRRGDVYGHACKLSGIRPMENYRMERRSQWRRTDFNRQSAISAPIDCVDKDIRLHSRILPQFEHHSCFLSLRNACLLFAKKKDIKQLFFFIAFPDTVLGGGIVFVVLP